MSTPLVSVVIPNYNYARFLRECINSVLAQTYSPIEIIVVDDGSTDESGQVLQSFGNKIRVINQKNGGVSSARNRGIKEAKGEYLAFLDADDAWKPEKIAIQVAALQGSNAGMVYTGLQLMDEHSCFTGRVVEGASGDVLAAIASMQPPGVAATGSSPVVRKECLEVVGDFDTRLSTSADWDLWARIAARYEVGFVAEPLTMYRLHGNGMHLNPVVLERDNLLALSKVFDNPAAERAHHLRRKSFSKAYSILAGSYLHARHFRRGLLMLTRSVLLWPPSLIYAMAFPWRYLRRMVTKVDSGERKCASPQKMTVG